MKEGLIRGMRFCEANFTSPFHLTPSYLTSIFLAGTSFASSFLASIIVNIPLLKFASMFRASTVSGK